MRWTTTTSSTKAGPKTRTEPRPTGAQKKAVNDKIKKLRKLAEQTYDDVSLKLLDNIQPIATPVRQISLTWLQETERNIDRAYKAILQDYERAQEARKAEPDADIKIHLESEGQAPDAIQQLNRKSKPNPIGKIIGWGFLLLLILWISARLPLSFALLSLLPLYGLPTMLAYLKEREAFKAIRNTNMFLGWTVLGWIVALIWAYYGKPKPLQEARATRNPSTTTILRALIPLALLSPIIILGARKGEYMRSPEYQAILAQREAERVEREAKVAAERAEQEAKKASDSSLSDNATPTANSVEVVAQPSPFTDVATNDDIVIDSDPILSPLVNKAKASPAKKAIRAAKPANKPSKTSKP